MDYKLPTQYLKDMFSTARGTLVDAVYSAGQYVRGIGQSKAVRNGVILIGYLLGSVAIAANNTNYGGRQDPKPIAPSKQTDSYSGKSKTQTPAKEEKERKGLEAVLHAIWLLPGQIGKGVGNYFNKADHGYVTLDQALSKEYKGRNGEQFLESLGLMPGSIITDAKDLGVVVLVKYPQEVGRRAESKIDARRERRAPRTPRNRQGVEAVLMAIPDAAWDLSQAAVHGVQDLGTVGKYVVVVGVNGSGQIIGKSLEHAIKNPLDTTTRIIGTVVILDTIHDSSSSGGGVGEESPPPPPWP